MGGAIAVGFSILSVHWTPPRYTIILEEAAEVQTCDVVPPRKTTARNSGADCLLVLIPKAIARLKRNPPALPQ